MSAQSDIEKIILQEQTLVFDQFDEDIAFALGAAIRERGRSDGAALVVDVRTWDRQLFFSALAGTTADNAEWVRRKANSVRVLHKSTYRLVLENDGSRLFPEQRALDPRDFVMAGGGFPIRVRGAGVIGAVIVSGLPEREDHAYVVRGLAEHLGHDAEALALPPA